MHMAEVQYMNKAGELQFDLDDDIRMYRQLVEDKRDAYFNYDANILKAIEEAAKRQEENKDAN